MNSAWKPRIPLCAAIAAAFLLPAFSRSLIAQTSLTTAAGVLHPTNGGIAANGNRMIASGGGIWFLESNADRIAFYKDGTITEWQVRDNHHIGATPTDFELDGNLVWFIEAGQSLLQPFQSAFAQLDTSTGNLTEWVLPTARPSAFLHNGNDVWFAMSQGTLEHLDLTTLAVTDYRTPDSLACSTLVQAPDGSLFATDFGGNRIFRFDFSGSTPTATSWQMADPTKLILSPADARFDAAGKLWISEFLGFSLDRFDPSTGTYDVFSRGLVTYPDRLLISNGFIYFTESAAGTGRNGHLVVLDPNFAPRTTETLTAKDETVSSLAKMATVQTSTITPTTYTSAAADIAQANLSALTSSGISRTVFPSQSAYALAIDPAGTVWTGSIGNLVELTLQPAVSDLDLMDPIAFNGGGTSATRPRTDFTLYNRGTTQQSVTAVYYVSPGAAPPSTTTTVDSGHVTSVADALGAGGASAGDSFGPVRFTVNSGNAGDLFALARTYAVRADGGRYGFTVMAGNAADAVQAGQSVRLFLGTEPGETSVFAVTSENGGSGSATLIAPDGSVRGTLDFALTPNQRIEFNPAASGFGAAAEPGDTVRVDLSSGTAVPHTLIGDPSADITYGAALTPGTDFVLPAAGRADGAFGVTYSSDLLLASAGSPAHVTLAFYPAGASTAAPLVGNSTVPAGGSLTIHDLVSSLFGLSSGQGSVLLISDTPVAAALRIVTHAAGGDYSTLAPALPGTGYIPAGASEAGTLLGVAASTALRSNLVLFNRGSAGTMTLTGYDATGGAVGTAKFTVGDHQSFRINGIFPALGAPSIDTGRVTMTTSPGMRVYAWAASADNITGDPEVLPPVITLP
jgi:streptogramin lyase